jgi:nicotinamide mononucleotide transporter
LKKLGKVKHRENFPKQQVQIEFKRLIYRNGSISGKDYLCAVNEPKSIKFSLSIVIEALAVVFNLLFTLLYIQNNRWCFFFGIIGPLLLAFLCKTKKLYADAVLQIAYIGFAIYGLLVTQADWTPTVFPVYGHGIIVALGVVAVFTIGKILKEKTDAEFPLLDTFTTYFALAGTFLMMRLNPEAWIYLIVINSTSLLMYAKRKLYLGALMFALYLLMSIDGYFQLGLFS